MRARRTIWLVVALAAASPRAEADVSLRQALRFKEAMEHFEGRRYDKAAQVFLAFVADYPRHADADKALFNAAIASEKAGRFQEALKLYERLLAQYPKSTFASDAAHRAALDATRVLDLDRALKLYLMLAQERRHAGFQHRMDCLFNAALLLELKQDYARAAKLFTRFARQGKRDAMHARFRVLLLHEKRQDLVAMKRALAELSRRHNKDPALGPLLVEGAFRVGRRALAQKREREAKKHFKQALAAFQRRGLKPGSGGAEHAARAAYVLAELELRRLKQGGIWRLNRSGARIKRLTAQAAELTAAYQAILHYRSPRWSVAAACRTGLVQERLANAIGGGLRTARLPRRLGRQSGSYRDARDLLEAAIDRQVDPIVDRARSHYEACVKLARRLSVFDGPVEEALARLDTLRPGGPSLPPAAVADVARPAAVPLAAARQALARDPRDARALTGAAWTALGAGQHELARAICDRIRPGSKEAAGCLLVRGHLALARDEPLLALQLFERATKVDPAFGPGWATLGAQQLKHRNHTAALKTLQTAVKLLPRDAGVRLNLGSALRGADKLAAARAAYEEALSLRPGYPQAQFDLGLLALDHRSNPKLGRLEAAKAAVTQLERAEQVAAGQPWQERLGKLLKYARRRVRREERRIEREARRKARKREKKGE